MFYDSSEKLFCKKIMETTCPTDEMPENGAICRVCREIGKLSLN